uniref:Integrase catalytic domain-containing protein n=1 Tax=Neolamprologus brichardi TaxID=32507 RepID=A0A3Q4MK41_NEOBR
MIPELPTAPWKKVGTDLFHFNGKDYLLVIDYYSNFPEIALLTSTTANNVNTHVKSIFARHGIPETVISDNEYGFKHGTSSPQHPQQMARTADESTLPCYAESKQSEEIIKKQEHLKWKQKQQYDKGTRALGLLAKDDVVRIQDQNTWSRKAIVFQKGGPKSYDVRTAEGPVLRRNPCNLLKTKETFQEEQCSEEDENVDVSHAETVSDLKPLDGHENVEKSEVV